MVSEVQLLIEILRTLRLLHQAAQTEDEGGIIVFHHFLITVPFIFHMVRLLLAEPLCFCQTRKALNSRLASLPRMPSRQMQTTVVFVHIVLHFPFFSISSLNSPLFYPSITFALPSFLHYFTFCVLLKCTVIPSQILVCV